MRLFLAAAVLLAGGQSLALADTFGSGANTFTIDFTTIGDPGNLPDFSGDPSPAGQVNYVYGISTYEIPESAILAANAQSALDGNPLNITIDSRGPNMPATRVSWFEAARFVNWLNTSSGHAPAYNFDANGDFQLWSPGDVGFDADNPFRNTQAVYVLPSVDEWYKAAFYDPVSDTWFDFPSGMNSPPNPVASGTEDNTAVYDQPFSQGPAEITLAGGPSPFGTVGQGGNVQEWEETALDLVNDNPDELRAHRGGQWISGATPAGLANDSRGALIAPFVSSGSIGFRVVRIPEPSTLLLLATLFAAFALRRR